MIAGHKTTTASMPVTSELSSRNNLADQVLQKARGQAWATGLQDITEFSKMGKQSNTDLTPGQLESADATCPPLCVDIHTMLEHQCFNLQGSSLQRSETHAERM